MSAQSSQSYQVEGNVIYLTSFGRRAVGDGTDGESGALSGAGARGAHPPDPTWLFRLDPAQRVGLQRLQCALSSQWTPDRIEQKIRALGVQPEDLEEARRYVMSGDYDAHVAADAEIRRRMARAYGPRRIEAELLARGFDSAMVKDRLGAIDAERWTEILASWLGGEPLPAGPAERKKKMDVLLRRGFSMRQIEEYERSRTNP